MKKLNKLLSLLLCLAAAISLYSCRSEFDVTLLDQKFTDSTTVKGKTRKVLYLIVDGARGQVVRDAGASNINSLLKNSTYSWFSLSDSLSNDPNGWTDLMAGVTKLKHNVKDAGFTGNSLTNYPVFFKHIKSANATVRIASFASSADFKNNLTAYADVSTVAANDAEVKSSVITELGNDSAYVVVGQFKEVNQAGLQYGYELSTSQYKNAILQFDTYLGEILTALRARKNYENEDWLVVLTSNHGGPAVVPPAQDDQTILSYPKSNTFTILYNAGYVQKQIVRPFAGNKFPGKFLRFYASAVDESKAVYGTVTNNNGIYDFGENIPFTIEAKIRKPTGGIYKWPIFLSKKGVSGNKRDGTGWHMSLEDGYWRFLMINGNKSSTWINGLPITDVNWHHIAVTVYTNTDGKRVMRTFHDGKRVVQNDAVSIANFNVDNNAPLKIGFYQTQGSDGVAFDGYLSDLRIWKINLPDETIANFACDTRINSSHPYYNELIGYWPLTDGAGLTLKDESLANNNFTVKVGTGTTLQWTQLNNIVCPPSSANLGLLVPRTYDLPRQILSWLTMPIPETLKLDGRVWLNY